MMDEESEGYAQLLQKIAGEATKKASQRASESGLKMMIVHGGHLCCKYPDGKIIKVKKI